MTQNLGLGNCGRFYATPVTKRLTASNTLERSPEQDVHIIGQSKKRPAWAGMLPILVVLDGGCKQESVNGSIVHDRIVYLKLALLQALLRLITFSNQYLSAQLLDGRQLCGKQHHQTRRTARKEPKV